MTVVMTWVICALIVAVLLFVGGAKTAEVRRINDELLDQLATLVNACEEHPEELSDYLDDIIEQSRDVVVAYDEYSLTADTLPR